MSRLVPRAALDEALAVMFGPLPVPAARFLRELEEARLREVFRSRALQTHPDRSAVLGQDRELLHERFLKLVWAYDTLRAALGNGAGPEPSPQPERPPRTASPPPPPRPRSEHFYRGPMPRRVLRLGEFLYYSGQVSWQTLISSLVWQKQRRPRFGQVAVSWRLLTPQQAELVLRRKQWGERFGECAVRLGLMVPFWVRSILLHQSRRQPRLGSYFLEQGLLSPQELHQWLHRLAEHNRRLRSGAAGPRSV